MPSPASNLGGVFSVLTMFVGAPQASAQPGMVEEARKFMPPGLLSPMATLETEDAFGRTRSVVALYYDYAQRRPNRSSSAPRYLARRSQQVGDARPRLDWADTNDCPALHSVVESFAFLPIPSVQIDGAPSSRPATPPPVDGTRHTIWTSRGKQINGERADLEVSATYGPLATWVAMSNDALRPCWREAQPKL